ncbi:protein FAM131C [Fukomys damarensis]|uniref:protein FAM131C n=1 Tax=Fukomys damarensis TaxID=885580 RepID=UPI00053FC867|nr:protein FAM131C [Fukomys damarensis]
MLLGSWDLFTSAHKDCPMPQGTEPLTPGLPSPYSPAFAVDHVTGKDKQLDFCWDPWQRCLQTTNGYLSDSRACASNCSVAALATSSLVGRFWWRLHASPGQSHGIGEEDLLDSGLPKHQVPGWLWGCPRLRVPASGWPLTAPVSSPSLNYPIRSPFLSSRSDRTADLPPAVAAMALLCHPIPGLPCVTPGAGSRCPPGVAEQFAITEATLSAWSSQDAEELRPEDSPRDPVPLQDLESSYLPDSLLSGPLPDDSLLAFSSAGLSPDGWPSPQEPPATLLAFSSPGLSPDGWPSPEEPPITAASLQHPSPEQQQRRRLPGGPGPEGQDPLQGSLPSVDSGSLSEDEVFYN